MIKEEYESNFCWAEGGNETTAFAMIVYDFLSTVILFKTGRTVDKPQLPPKEMTLK